MFTVVMGFLRTRAVVRTSVVALLVGLAGVAIHVRTAAPSDLVNSASGAFKITGTVTGMTPGLETTLVLRVENPQTTQLSLRSIGASVVAAVYTGTKTPAPARCAGYLSPKLPHTWLTWAGATTVPAASSPLNPGAITISVPLSFANSATNQDECENVKFILAFSGLAYYTDPTSTRVTASPNPVNEGASVTLTATVSPTYSGTTPTGTMSFSGPSGPIAGSPVTLSAAGHGDQATAKLTTTGLPVGTSLISAVYSPAGAHNGGPDFLESSATTSETVCVRSRGSSPWLDDGTTTARSGFPTPCEPSPCDSRAPELLRNLVSPLTQATTGARSGSDGHCAFEDNLLASSSCCETAS